MPACSLFICVNHSTVSENYINPNIERDRKVSHQTALVISISVYLCLYNELSTVNCYFYSVVSNEMKSTISGITKCCVMLFLMNQCHFSFSVPVQLYSHSNTH
jgi:hypothetical protein